MMIEIESTAVESGFLYIYAYCIDDLNLQKLERQREQENPLRTFAFDLHSRFSFKYIWRWLHNQKATKDATTLEEARKSIHGTTTEISSTFILPL